MATFDSTFYNISFNASGQKFFFFTSTLIDAQVTSTSTVSLSSLMLIERASASVGSVSTVTATAALRESISASVTTQSSVNLSLNAISASAAISAGKFKTIVAALDLYRPSLLQDTAGIKQIFAIDGVPLTEQTRKFDKSLKPLRSVNTKWNGSKGVYYKISNNKNSFVLQWTYIPGKRENTVDLLASRDYIKNMASSQNYHTFTVRNLDSNGLTKTTFNTYNVLVMNYSESLIRRDLTSDEYYWSCSLTLDEV
jgi:hypothetical protein